MAPRRGRDAKPKRSKGQPSEAELDFMIHAEKILTGYRARQKEREANPGKQPRPPFDQAEGFLKRECYALIRNCISGKKGAQIIKSIVRRNLIEPPYHRYADNPYFWGLIAIDAPDRELGAQRISRYAMQMLYAHQNYVLPIHLVGFLYQIGGHATLREIRSDAHKHPSLMMSSLDEHLG